METKLTTLPHSQKEIIIQLSKDDLAPFENDALREIGKSLKIAGYRPGKAPLDLIKNKVSPLELEEKAALLAIEKKYPQYIKENKIKAIGYPDIKITKIIPGKIVELKALITVIPSLQLPDYKNIAASMQKNRKDIKIDDKEIIEALHWLQNSHSQLKAVTRPAKENDVVTIDYKIKSKEKIIPNGEDKNYSFILGKGHFIPGFEKEIEGMKIKENKSFSLKVPTNWREKELRNKKLSIAVTLKEIKERITPPLDDQFAQKVGKFKTLTELKENIKNSLEEEKRRKEKERWRLAVLDKIIAHINNEIPSLLVENELEKIIKELKIRVEEIHLSFDKYLEQIKKTKEELEKELRPLAEKRAKAALLLKEIADKENITVSPEEIQKKSAAILQQIPEEENRQKINQENLDAFSLGLLRSEKVFQFLEKQKEKST